MHSQHHHTTSSVYTHTHRNPAGNHRTTAGKHHTTTTVQQQQQQQATTETPPLLNRNHQHHHHRRRPPLKLTTALTTPSPGRADPHRQRFTQRKKRKKNQTSTTPIDTNRPSKPQIRVKGSGNRGLPTKINKTPAEIEAGNQIGAHPFSRRLCPPSLTAAAAVKSSPASPCLPVVLPFLSSRRRRSLSLSLCVGVEKKRNREQRK
ncbi:hypothetical protein Dimus_038534 [Dionaea muscipula]